MIRWQRALATVCLAAAIGGPAAAQSPARPHPGVIDGQTWMDSSMGERRAFLVGAANMIMLEEAYAKRRGTPAPAAGGLATKAVANMSIGEIEARITRWYRQNPDKLGTPVMGVVWTDIVQPR